MVINVSQALCNLTSEPVTVERTTGGGFVDGIYQKGASATFKMIASVQQPTADDLEQLPEGERNKDIRKFISNKLVRTASDRDGLIADLVIYDGIKYKIISVQDWSKFGQTTSFGAREK